jgi:hypothetical protein
MLSIGQIEAGAPDDVPPSCLAMAMPRADLAVGLDDVVKRTIVQFVHESGDVAAVQKTSANRWFV